MKIALIGYGRMGHVIERIALGRGHEIVARIDIDNQADFDSPEFASADVAIEFTQPGQALGNICKAWAKRIPVVCGTTGWKPDAALATLADELDGTLLHATNFSVGVNLLFALNKYLARIIAPFGEYKVSIDEEHHIHKLDHPSGTAITLADGIIANTELPYSQWSESTPEAVAADTISMQCSRAGENPGFHEVKWESAVDTISISHQAKGREGFALGAVIAAEWLVKQPVGKIYTLDQMFNF